MAWFLLMTARINAVRPDWSCASTSAPFFNAALTSFSLPAFTAAKSWVVDLGMPADALGRALMDAPVLAPEASGESVVSELSGVAGLLVP